jgi:hypothetical protein
MENIVEVEHIVTQPVQLQLSGASHHNQRLFSDHYLDHILPKHWDSLRDEASQVMTQLQQLYARFTPNINNEAQTEDDWIKPVLRAMGHTFEVQAGLKTPDGAKRPDYFFYRDNAALVANKNKILDADDLEQGALP